MDIKYDCDVIRDLIPLYRDKVVSKTIIFYKYRG